MTGQDVVNAVSTDIRSTLGSSGADATTILGWVDRIHKDVLHTSIYNYLIRNVTNITTVTGIANYTLPTPRRQVTMVYDRTFNRQLLPMYVAAMPISTEDLSGTAVIQSPSEEQIRSKPVFEAKTQAQFPKYYFDVGTTGFFIFPAPSSTTYVSTLEVYYETAVTTVSSLSTTLTPPDDALDLMVTGVDFLACIFLSRTNEAQAWYQLYNQLKMSK